MVYREGDVGDGTDERLEGRGEVRCGELDSEGNVACGRNSEKL